MAYIKCQNLSVGYTGETLIENINFEVHEHDYLCIVGENGVGKSTLMKTLLGLVDKKEGNVEFGKNINRKEVGYLPQQTALQKDFPATVMEVVLSGNLSKIALRPFYRKKEKERALMVSHDLSVLEEATHILYLRKNDYVYARKEEFMNTYGKEMKADVNYRNI